MSTKLLLFLLQLSRYLKEKEKIYLTSGPRRNLPFHTLLFVLFIKGCGMGVTVEVWRARIGMFGTSAGRSILATSLSPSEMLDSVCVLCVIVVLLLIGNVERNPGPVDVFACNACEFKAKSAEEYLQHQQLHVMDFNFIFSCPYPTCYHSYSSHRSLRAHLCEHRPLQDGTVGEATSFKCAHCEQSIISNRDYCRHLRTHLRDGIQIHCPLSSCSRTRKFTSTSVFSTHLSQCHSGWQQDFSCSALQGAAHQPAFGAAGDKPYEVHGLEEPAGASVALAVDEEEYLDAFMDHDETTSSCNSVLGESIFDHDQVVAYIANLYAFLEGDKIVPSTTVDALADKLSFISEILQSKLKRDLARCLASVGVSESDASRVIQSVITMDPLYNSHHVHAPGDCLLTSARRKTYYSNHFKYLDPIEINLKKNPHDMEDTLQYVGVKENLLKMLQDASVQKVVDESFIANDSNGSIFKNYTDGAVFRGSETPMKRIDIFLYMDAFTCANPLGSAKLKYKIHGIYMTLGNLKPYMRSFLRALKLVMLVNEKSLKKSDRMYKKCFSKLLEELKDLEGNGIDYKGGRVPVRLQFIQGDNLGQHALGGFLESFTTNYFCRYCEISNEEFKNQADQEKPKFHSGPWRTPESFNNNVQQKITLDLDHLQGIKRDSPFHVLNHFHVCQPRLPPCIGHDLFIGGVVDRDMTSIINHFIENGWFTLHELNMRNKRFKYFDKDQRNKPAEFKGTGRLGGHAVQNWTMLRLLPLLIGEKVNTEDKFWKLYLLLKSVVELVCAPALSADQVELMKRLIKKYMRRRKLLPNNYVPKHHYFSHYADLFLLFGPLIHMWTMAFEHRHQYFKRVAHICRNFINLSSLLGKRFQLLQAHQSMGPLFPTEAIFSKSFPLKHGNFEEDVTVFLSTCNFSDEAVEVEKLSLNEIMYMKKQWLLLGKAAEHGIIIVGFIQLLVFDDNKCHAVIKKYKAQKWQEYGLYSFVDGEPEQSSIELKENDDLPSSHAVYEFMGKQCLSLKHVFLE